ERERAIDELVDRIDRLLLRRERGDLLHAGHSSLRADIDENEPGQPAAVASGPRQPVGSAERHADQHEPSETQAIDDRLVSADVTLGPVVQLRRPFAVAVPGLIEGQAVAVPSQTETHEIPRVRVQPAAVEEENRRTALRSPIEVVKAHATEDDVVRLGQRELGEGETRLCRRSREMLAKLGVGQAHPRTLTSFSRLRSPGGMGPRRPQFVYDTSPT